MTGIIRTEWFGRQISVLLTTGKTLTGELSEVTDTYLVLDRESGQVQIMGHAVVAVRLAIDKEAGQET